MIVGVGTDLVDCRRIGHIVSRVGERFLEKVFTEHERAFCDNRKARRFEAYGTTFAAKEAALKAIAHVKGIRWHDIEVVRESGGRPTLKFYGAARGNLEKKCQQFRVHLSLSDEPPYAQAFVAIESQEATC